jgi:DNA polymerase-4/DNA polymerase V
VAVEVAKNPSLKGLPVVTGGERGIASAFSYEAKALGITRVMPIQKIKKDFPQVIILNGDYASYRNYSKKMFDIVRRYADEVEEYSIDECFADITGLDKPLKMSYLEIAERIKNEVTQELGLSVTIGLAPTKVLAKVASNWKKPNGLTIITAETATTFLKGLPIAKVWGIGPRTADALIGKWVTTAHDFTCKDDRWVFGNLSSNYFNLWKELRGISILKVNQEIKTNYSSIQRIHTFHPVTKDKKFLLAQLSRHIEDVCSQARKYSLLAKKCTFVLRNQKLQYTSFTIVFSQPTNAPEVIIGLVQKNFDNLYRDTVLYRATVVTLQNLVTSVTPQTTLFDTADTRADKLQAIHKEIDALEKKFGKRMVHLASTQEALSSMTETFDEEDESRNLLFT